MKIIQRYTCPICGFSKFTQKLYINGVGQNDICSCCGFEYGYDDTAENYTFDMWRKKWIFGEHFEFIFPKNKKQISEWNINSLLKQLENLYDIKYIVDIENGIGSSKSDDDNTRYVDNPYWMYVYTLEEYIGFLKKKYLENNKYLPNNSLSNREELNKENKDICSVCGWDGTKEKFYKNGNPTGAQCECCGFKSGITDNEEHNDFAIWRKKWMDTNNFNWFCKDTTPKDWGAEKAIKQLKNLEFVNIICIPNIETRLEQKEFKQKVYTLEEFKQLLLDTFPE